MMQDEIRARYEGRCIHTRSSVLLHLLLPVLRAAETGSVTGCVFGFRAKKHEKNGLFR